MIDPTSIASVNKDVGSLGELELKICGGGLQINTFHDEMNKRETPHPTPELSMGTLQFVGMWSIKPLAGRWV